MTDFVDGASMLIEVPHNMERKLLNTFYMQSSMELDLKNIKYIDDYALNGCLAHAAINCDSLNMQGQKLFAVRLCLIQAMTVSVLLTTWCLRWSLTQNQYGFQSESGVSPIQRTSEC